MEEYVRRHLRSKGSIPATPLIFLCYLLLPYLFFTIGSNIWNVALAPRDAYLGGVPYKVFIADMPLWNPYLETGSFNIKDIGVQFFYIPAILIMKVFPNPFGYNFLLLIHYTLAGFFTFLFLRALRLNRVASFIGGVTFMFCGFMCAQRPHTTLMMTAAYLPIVLYFFENFMAAKTRTRLFLAAIAFALSILADYPAVSLYIGMVLIPYIAYRVLTGAESRDKSIRVKILEIAAYSSAILILGLVLTAAEVLPILESLKYSSRQSVTYDFFASYSFPFRALPLLIFPYIFGASPAGFFQPAYFGPWSLLGMSGYMGILPMLFAFLAVILFRKTNGQILFWAAVALIAFLLVLGDSTPLYRVLYKIPVYNMFRAPTRNWMEVDFAVAILSSFFIHFMMTSTEIRALSYYRAMLWVVGVLFISVLFILIVGRDLIPSRAETQQWIENTRITSHAVLVPLVTIFISSVMLWLVFRYRSSNAFWALSGMLVFLDLFSFGYFIGENYPAYKFFQKQPNAIAQFLDAQRMDKTQYRILTLLGQSTNAEAELAPDINLLYRVNLTNGYIVTALEDYRKLTSFEINGISLQKYKLLYNSRILSSLSTKYIITSDQVDKSFLGTLLADTQSGQDKLIVDGFGTPGWSFVGSENRTAQSVTLRSRQPGRVSQIRIPIALQPRTSYRIAFKARITDASPPSDMLVVDFVGKNYESAVKQVHFEGNSGPNAFQEFSADFYSGESTPPLAYLRVLNSSKIPYEISSIQLYQVTGGAPYWGTSQSIGGSVPLYVKDYESPAGIAVYENLNFLPRARFVKNVRAVNAPAAAITTYWEDSSFDPSLTALVEGYSGKTGFDNGDVVSADYSNTDRVTLSVTTGNRSFLVLSDSWYPGWYALVDGKETPIYRTNAISRGIVINGEGEHKVEFRFAPMSFYIGLGVTTLTLVMMGLVVAYEKRKQHEQSVRGIPLSSL
jgi:hypothetical protein